MVLGDPWERVAPPLQGVETYRLRTAALVHIFQNALDCRKKKTVVTVISQQRSFHLTAVRAISGSPDRGGFKVIRACVDTQEPRELPKG